MNFNKIYALGLRHLYLIMNSFPRVLDLIYWPTVQIFLWGFISKFFTLNSEYYNNTVGVILSAAILYDFLFRASISFNMMFLEEIWSRNFTNLFIAPIKIREIIAALTLTAILRTLIGLVPAVLIAIPLFGVSVLKIGLPLIFLLIEGTLANGRPSLAESKSPGLYFPRRLHRRKFYVHRRRTCVSTAQNKCKIGKKKFSHSKKRKKTNKVLFLAIGPLEKAILYLWMGFVRFVLSTIVYFDIPMNMLRGFFDTL